ncbi:hypothetical protein [uncultured Deinococcus sp.]|uniref:hypothetical protein n=1 Tax=uncultured Deinococcus sp. TaxID=158789 RepID=UPI0025E3C445|nr:hypothetical protein [uncultured Deinococcus sp.]
MQRSRLPLLLLPFLLMACQRDNSIRDFMATEVVVDADTHVPATSDFSHLDWVDVYVHPHDPAVVAGATAATATVNGRPVPATIVPPIPASSSVRTGDLHIPHLVPCRDLRPGRTDLAYTFQDAGGHPLEQGTIVFDDVQLTTCPPGA